MLTKVFWLLVAMNLSGSVGLISARAQGTTVPEGRKIPFNRTVVTTCPETKVRLRGAFRAQFSVTRDASGDSFMAGDFNAEGITGIGLRSGSLYRANGTSHIDSRGPLPIKFTYVFNFVLNKVGSTDSLMGHAKFHLAVNANGAVNANVLNVSIDCNK